MSEFGGFERLLETAGLITRHADFPGKGHVMEQCRAEIADLASSGAITRDQRDVLWRELLGGGSEGELNDMTVKRDSGPDTVRGG